MADSVAWLHRFYHIGRPFLLLGVAQVVDFFVTSRLVGLFLHRGELLLLLYAGLVTAFARRDGPAYAGQVRDVPRLGGVRGRSHERQRPYFGTIPDAAPRSSHAFSSGVSVRAAAAS